MAHGKIQHDLTANNSDLNAKLKAAKSKIKGYASSIAATLKIAAAAFLAVGAAVTGVSAYLLSLYSKQEKAEAKLASVLKATKNAVGLSRDELQGYAADLQKITTYADETTISAMGVLATFTKIRGDQFKEATKAAMDMSAVLETDLQGSILQIGKALNDPIKGITALSRAGVSFTEQQKEQIKALQESGDIIGAQKIILDELKGEFGGASEALANTFGGRVAQLKNKLGDFGEKLGEIIAPAAGKMIEWLDAATDKLDEITPYIKASFAVYAEFITASWERAAGATKTLVDFISDGFNTVQHYISDVWKHIVGNHGEAFSKIIGHLDVMLGSWEGFRGGIVQIWNQAMLAIQAAWDSATSYLAEKMVSIQGFFKDAWHALGEIGVAALTEPFARFMIWIEKKLAWLRGEKWLLTEEEETNVIQGTRAQALNDLAAKRKANEKETNEQIEAIRQAHEAKMAAIGAKSLKMTEEWEKQMGQLPRLSQRLADAWNGAFAEPEKMKEAQFKAAQAANADASSDKSKSSGRVGAIETAEVMYKRIASSAMNSRPADRTANATEKCAEHLKAIRANQKDQVAAKPQPVIGK